MSHGDELKKLYPEEDLEKLSSSGMDITERTRSASYLQEDDKLVLSRSLIPGVEICGIEEAITNPQYKNYFGKAFKILGRQFPQDTKGGYFIRVKKNTEVKLPIQACLFLKRGRFEQKVHNLIIVEEGAKVYLITGCSSSSSAQESFHLGISEFFVGRGAYLNFTMIHSWRQDVTVRPISIALVEEGATFVSNYICLRPVKEIIMYPTALLNGKFARASFNSLILSHPGSLQDIGSRAILNAGGTSAEIIARAVSLGGQVIARGHLKAQVKNVKAHLECRGLIISEEGKIHAIPELETEYRDVELSHEAAIGKISKEEIEYLCARGFSKEEAQAIIIRGFMDVEILALPDLLKKEIKELEEKTLQGSL
jgi:hypothetical protein